MHENQTSAGMWHSRPPRDPPPFMAKTILNFHFDYWNPSLNLTICTFVLNSLKIQISHRASVLSLVHIVPAIRLGSLGKCPVCASRKVNLIAFLQIPSGSVRVGQIGLPWNFIMAKPALVLTELLHWARLHQHPVDRDRLLLPGIGCSTMWKLIYVWHILYIILHSRHCNAMKVPARETKARKLICFACWAHLHQG